MYIPFLLLFSKKDIWYEMVFFFSEVDMQLGRRRMQIELGMHALTGHVDTRADVACNTWWWDMQCIAFAW